MVFFFLLLFIFFFFNIHSYLKVLLLPSIHSISFHTVKFFACNFALSFIYAQAYTNNVMLCSIRVGDQLKILKHSSVHPSIYKSNIKTLAQVWYSLSDAAIEQDFKMANNCIKRWYRSKNWIEVFIKNIVRLSSSTQSK